MQIGSQGGANYGLGNIVNKSVITMYSAGRCWKYQGDTLVYDYLTMHMKPIQNNMESKLELENK